MRPQRTLLQRSAFLIPSIFTLGNMFCGFACLVYAMQGRFERAAPFIGWAVVVDIFDGRVARLTGTTSKFGLEFDSLADITSFGIAPALLGFTWGLQPLGRLGWAVGFLYVAAAAIRLARFNVQSSTDKRYFVGLPSPAAAGIIASTIFAYPAGFSDDLHALLALLLLAIPAALMLSTIRFRASKGSGSSARRQYITMASLVVLALLIAARPQVMLVLVAYVYLSTGLIGWALARFRRRRVQASAAS